MEEVLGFLQGPLVADIASHVFSFLSVVDKQNVAKVCRFWRRIVYLPGLWKDVTVELPLQPSHWLIVSLRKRGLTRITCLRSTEEDLSDLFSSVPNLSHLSIIGCSQVSEDFLVKAIPSLTCVQHIAFRKCRQVINANRLLKAMRSPNLTKTLKSFALEDCRYATHAGLKALLPTLSNLEKLDLSYVRLNSSCLQVLANSCPKLKLLGLKRCQGVDDDSLKLLAEKLDLEYLDMSGLFDLTLDSLTCIANNLTDLKSLTLGSEEWRIYSDHGTIDDLKVVLEEVSKLYELEFLAIEVDEIGFVEEINLLVVSTLMKLPNLKRLHLGSIDSINDDTMIQLADFLPELKTLTFCSKMVKDAGITALCSKLKGLKALSLNRCSITDKGIEEISKLPKLETLNLSYNKKFTSAGIKHLVNIKSLTSLHLGKCDQVTDKDVKVIALGMPQLAKLDLEDCHQISSQGAITIGKHLKNLDHLALDDTQINDKGFVFVSQNLPKLQELSVCDCCISDEALINGAKSLGNLKVLKIGSMFDTHDKGLEEAAQYLRGLTEMALKQAFCVSIEGVEAIVISLPNLVYLEVDNCKHITPGMVRHLQHIAKITVHSY